MVPAEQVRFAGSPDVRSVFFVQPGDGLKSRKSTARKIVGRFAYRAFRRPVMETELEQLMGPCDDKLSGGRNFRDSVKLGLMTVLMSPHFLYRIELAPGDGKDERRLSDYELASRLSFFLWMSIPDAELLQLAGEGRLSDPKIFDEQVQRLLDDPKSGSFTSSFMRQWLGYGEIGRTIKLDPKRFPEFDEQLLSDMVEESRTYFSALVHENRSLLELIDSDYTFLNEDLAKHYGIAGGEGSEFRRVELVTSPRGGVLDMASVLTASSSNPTRTSPVNRGNYVLEKFFGERLEAPDLVPSLPDAAGNPGAALSFRQELEKHRDVRSCAVCHDRIDPVGFGLENFDSIGRWRTEVGGKPVDARGVLPQGESFSGPKELSLILLSRKEDLVVNLIEQMLRFALGRELEYYDVPMVKSIASTMARDGYRVRTLLSEIVRSYPFHFQNQNK